MVVIEGRGLRAHGNAAAKRLLGLSREAGSEAVLSALREVPELSSLLQSGSGRGELSIASQEGPVPIRRVEARAYCIRRPWPRVLIVLVDVTENAELLERLSNLASKDPLTGLYNRRRFDELGARDIELSRRSGASIGVLMLDIDLFKRVNDDHGHDVGDQALKAVSAACLEGLRSTDILARYGGEEFAVLLPGSGADESVFVAERLRAQVFAASVPCSEGRVSVTISAGAYAAVPNPQDDLSLYLRRADEALYRSKAMGRNRVSYWEPLRPKGSP
jgi:diguanylate cyclase (GGDEF)-like protein